MMMGVPAERGTPDSYVAGQVLSLYLADDWKVTKKLTELGFDTNTSRRHGALQPRAVHYATRPTAERRSLAATKSPIPELPVASSRFG
jgi:hypothetical protein